MLEQFTDDSVVKVRHRNAKDASWQNRLLPLMVGMLIGLTAFFCASNIFQVYVLNSHIKQVAEPNLDSALDLLHVDAQTNTSDRLKFATFKTEAMLEGYAIRYRYHQASVASMGRVYLIYLGFTTGMVLAMVGAAFILGKLKESQSMVSTENSLLKLSITSASPGLILATLGTLLMFTTILARADVQVKDGALFLRKSDETAVASPAEQRAFDQITEDAKRIEEQTEKDKK